MYSANFTPEGLQVKCEKACVVNCTFDKFGVKNHLGQYI